LYKNLNHFISKNISITKNKKEELNELNRFKSFIKRKNINLKDITPEQIHYICIFSNISLLKYLYKQNVDLFISNSDFVKNIEVMLMSNHLKAIKLFYELYFIKLNTKDKRIVTSLLFNKILYIMSYPYFVNLIECFNLYDNLKQDCFIDNIGYSIRKNHPSFNKIIEYLNIHSNKTFRIIVNDKDKYNYLTSKNKESFYDLKKSYVWKYYCILKKENEKNIFLKEIILMELEEDRKRFFSKYFFN